MDAVGRHPGGEQPQPGAGQHRRWPAKEDVLFGAEVIEGDGERAAPLAGRGVRVVGEGRYEGQPPPPGADGRGGDAPAGAVVGEHLGGPPGRAVARSGRGGQVTAGEPVSRR